MFSVNMTHSNALELPLIPGSTRLLRRLRLAFIRISRLLFVIVEFAFKREEILGESETVTCIGAHHTPARTWLPPPLQCTAAHHSAMRDSSSLQNAAIWGICTGEPVNTEETATHFAIARPTGVIFFVLLSMAPSSTSSFSADCRT